MTTTAATTTDKVVIEKRRALGRGLDSFVLGAAGGEESVGAPACCFA